MGKPSLAKKQFVLKVNAGYQSVEEVLRAKLYQGSSVANALARSDIFVFHPSYKSEQSAFRSHPVLFKASAYDSLWIVVNLLETGCEMFEQFISKQQSSLVEEFKEALGAKLYEACNLVNHLIRRDIFMSQSRANAYGLLWTLSDLLETGCELFERLGDEKQSSVEAVTIPVSSKES